MYHLYVYIRRKNKLFPKAIAEIYNSKSHYLMKEMKKIQSAFFPTHSSLSDLNLLFPV